MRAIGLSSAIILIGKDGLSKAIRMDNFRR